jgi:hypothetical protein
MTKQESVNVQIVGMANKVALDSLSNKSRGQHHQLGINKYKVQGIQALRHKKTGEIVIPSMYYALVKGTIHCYWDSADNKTYNLNTYTSVDDDIIDTTEDWLKSTSREALDNYELIFIKMKEGYSMPYRHGYHYFNNSKGVRVSIYNAGIAGIPRSVYNTIEEIIVLQDTFNSPNADYKESKENHPRAPNSEEFVIMEV